MMRHCFLVFFLLNICHAQDIVYTQDTVYAQDVVIDTTPSVAEEIKENLMTLLQYEIQGEYQRAYDSMTDDVFKSIMDQDIYRGWAKNKFKDSTHVPPLRFGSFFVKKKTRMGDRVTYMVQFTLVDKKGKVLISDDSSCYMFSKAQGTFKLHLFVFDCDP
ncbi:MAG: hypothetical protein LGR52_06065 [Candidatus Thiosymbion ectosymbiont of Robbea hypermnestra]|nr:hypothetical protein [Candidatus Thiosymbion ectosymbiont of Robbea hypermnestra]